MKIKTDLTIRAGMRYLGRVSYAIGIVAMITLEPTGWATYIVISFITVGAWGFK